MIYGTLWPCGVVVCDDIWDTEGCSVLRCHMGHYGQGCSGLL